MSRLDGKVMIVTGGGSSLGRAIAIRLAQEGGRVVVADKTSRAVATPKIIAYRINPAAKITPA